MHHINRLILPTPLPVASCVMSWFRAAWFAVNEAWIRFLGWPNLDPSVGTSDMGLPLTESDVCFRSPYRRCGDDRRTHHHRGEYRSL